MNVVKNLIVAATLASSLAAFPALAKLAPVGSVMIAPVDTRATVTYPGNITADILALTARNADVACRTVTAVLADGSTVELFRGVLVPNSQFKLYLPGNARTIQRMDFDCLSIDRGRAIINVNVNGIPPELAALG
jgi:hypothetical protein